MRSTNFVAPLFAKRRLTIIRADIFSRLSSKLENKCVIFNNRHLYTSLNKEWLSLHQCSWSKQSLNNFCSHLYRIHNYSNYCGHLYQSPQSLSKFLWTSVPKPKVTQLIFLYICTKVHNQSVIFVYICTKAHSHSANVCIHLYQSPQSLNHFVYICTKAQNHSIFCVHLYQSPKSLNLFCVHLYQSPKSLNLFCVHLYQSPQSPNKFLYTSVPKPVIIRNKFFWTSVPKLRLSRKEWKKLERAKLHLWHRAKYGFRCFNFQAT